MSSAVLISGTDETFVEQAMVLLRHDLQALYLLVGLHTAARDVVRLTLWGERLGNAVDILSWRRDVHDLGRSSSQAFIESFTSVLRDDWNYCARRASGGFGNPRRLVLEIASLIRGEREKEGEVWTDEGWLMLMTVVTVRSDLNRICECNGTKSIPQHDKEENICVPKT